MGGGKFLRKKDPLLKSPSEGIQKFPTDSNHPPPPKIPPKKNPKGTKPPKINANNKIRPSLKSTFAPTEQEIAVRPIVFFDITINDVPAGTVFFELFNETVPRTAENFRALTTGKLL